MTDREKAKATERERTQESKGAGEQDRRRSEDKVGDRVIHTHVIHTQSDTYSG